MEIAVAATHETHFRAASALISHPDVERLGLVEKRPPRSWGKRAVRAEDSSGFEILISDDPSNFEGVMVSTGCARSGVSWASAVGLLRSLGALVTGDADLYRTVPGKPSRLGAHIWMPEPIGRRRVNRYVDGIALVPIPGSVGALLASGPARMLAVVDDYEFLDAACLAAGALLAGRGWRGPVWENARAYVDACGELGVVVSEAVTGER